MKDNQVWVRYISDEGESKQERAIVLYWGHAYEMVPTPTLRLLDGALIREDSVMPMQVVAVVVRVISTGEVMQMKPEAIRFDPTTSKLSP
jgi:hypothetical protein